jgi:hypothetical protein
MGISVNDFSIAMFGMTHLSSCFYSQAKVRKLRKGAGECERAS